MPLADSDDEIAALLRRARSIAVVGLSVNPGRDSHRVARYLQLHGYSLHPVNPIVNEVLGLRSFPDLTSIGHPVDIVDVFRRAEFLPAIAEDAVRSGAGALWMQFTTVHEEALAIASGAGMIVVANRCILAEHRRLLA